MKRVLFTVLACSLFLNMASAQTVLPTAPTWYCSTTPPQPVPPPPQAAVTCDQEKILAAIADVKQTMTDQHTSQTNFFKSVGTFIVNNWPVIVSAVGTFATCKASGKC